MRICISFTEIIVLVQCGMKNPLLSLRLWVKNEDKNWTILPPALTFSSNGYEGSSPPWMTKRLHLTTACNMTRNGWDVKIMKKCLDVTFWLPAAVWSSGFISCEWVLQDNHAQSNDAFYTTTA